MYDAYATLRSLPAQQQPAWQDHEETRHVTAELAACPPLVEARAVQELRARLAEAAAGRVQIIQAGDCAEDWSECGPGDVARKAALLDALADTMRMVSPKPILRVGRLAGQFAKPRSQLTETVNGVELPVYRGHMVNSPEPDVRLRRPDPRRMLVGYQSARNVMEHLGWQDADGGHRPGAPVWTSHEALLLDYELPMLRRQPDGRTLLTSTHWPWIGERTRQPDSAHVAMLAAVTNPVACKVGPRTTVNELITLCRLLDPEREPGRLTLIARMGAAGVSEILPALVTAVRSAGHPVIWLTDPMHENTVRGPDGLKTRFLEAIMREVVGFHNAVTRAGGVTGGLHLETTPDEVTECVADEANVHEVKNKYMSLCDPRLNPHQAVSVAACWRG